MAEMAIDPAILVGIFNQRPMTPRAARRFKRCNPRRARGDKCHEREQKRSEGRRDPALASAIRKAIEQQLDDPISGYEELEPEPHRCSIDFRRVAQRWVKTRRREDLREIQEQESAYLFSVENRLHRLRRKTEPYLERRHGLLNALVNELEGLENLSGTAAEQLIAARTELFQVQLLLQY